MIETFSRMIIKMCSFRLLLIDYEANPARRVCLTPHLHRPATTALQREGAGGSGLLEEIKKGCCTTLAYQFISNPNSAISTNSASRVGIWYSK